jgi:glycine/D-amino acid oxidase-like deaminating enzyme/nitrite reductase/ring-hydroxylating ferredoxin subunit
MRKSDEGRTLSYWEASNDLIKPSGTEIPAHARVCIVGGGIAGITTAYLLAHAGQQVIVIDDGLIGGGETCRTTAHLSNAIDDRIYRIEKWHGQEKARLAVESHMAAIDEIERIARAENIECDFYRVDGYLIEAENGEDDLSEELAAAHRCGFGEVQWADRAPIPDHDSGRCLRFPRQGQFHVLKYLNALAAIIEEKGGQLLSGHRVSEWSGGDSPRVVIDGGTTIMADKLVLATNYPLQSKMFAELPAYRTYAIGIHVPKGSIERCLIWDTGDPYIYVRTQPDGEHDLLIVGGEDHRTGQADDAAERFGRLEGWARERFHMAGKVAYKWSGQFMETHDGLGFLGRYSSDEPNVFLITGDSGMGMTHGTIGGMIISDLILGRTNPWTETYEPGRFVTQSIKEAIPEITASTVPYADWLTPGEVSSVREIEKGEGAIMRDGLKKIAVYRDENGDLHKRSATCTHMGCVVRFNSLEKTWDCPCHGSRFSVDGDPINSPAISPLGTVD